MQHSFGTLELLHKEMANISNEQKRHCRIGKVTQKAKPYRFSPALPKPIQPAGLKMWPHDGTPLPMPQWPYADVPPPQYMAKCGCKVGSVCNNVACPHRLVVTC